MKKNNKRNTFLDCIAKICGFVCVILAIFLLFQGVIHMDIYSIIVALIVIITEIIIFKDDIKEKIDTSEIKEHKGKDTTESKYKRKK